jgi:hypothetical protein
MTAVLILLPILTFLRVPSFVIGNNAIWFVRWQYTPEGFSIMFNPISLLAIASLIGLIGLWLSPKPKRSQNRHTNRS